jgi:hypothetical protein
MVKYTDPENPETATEVKFLDFQQSRRGCIYEDLHYFLLTSTTPETRKAHLASWARIYYDSFVGTLKDVGCPMPQNFTRGYFTDALWQSLLPGFVYNTFAIPFQLGKQDAGNDEAGKKDEEAEGSLEENAFDAGVNQMLRNFRKWTVESPRAIQRLLDVTTEFVELGLF